MFKYSTLQCCGAGAGAAWSRHLEYLKSRKTTYPGMPVEVVEDDLESFSHLVRMHKDQRL